ncbi:UbiA family prenyltransferase [Hymenobacter sp. BT175]|uniref:UbiA family prenyltransferase n=1 Tax=Hymenobacter translucens TaxID=2886507 RepID=UPI001D0E25F7|nr:UbiA family prenyltransferase [Hymenobacter translucens]MCC2546056.1 UbiA family prenyltransferase [Hymenobacter translucens]
MPQVSDEQQPAAFAWRAGLKSSIDAILYSSGLVAVAATALTWASFRYWRVDIPASLAALIFTATLFLYNLDGVLPYKYRQQAVLSERKVWMIRHRGQLLKLAVGCAALAAGLFWLGGWQYLFLFLSHLAAISLLYSLPVVRVRGRWWALRDLPLLKVFLIAYVWSAVTVWIPALHLGHAPASAEVVVLFARRFCFILALAFVFDIRDYTKDRLSGTRTFPGLLGVQATKGLALLSLALAAVLLPPGIDTAQALVLLVPTALAGAIIWFADEARPDYYYALLADGVMLVQFLAVYLVV